MRMMLPWIATCAVMLVGGAACGNDESKQERDAKTGGQASSADIKQACEVFTLDMARQLLGESAKQSETSAPFAGSSDDIAGSTCTYEAEDPESKTSLATTITASLMLKGAKTSTGRSSNRWTFEQAKAALEEAGEQTQAVTGIGDVAYYVGGVTNQLHAIVNEGEYELIVSAMQPGGDNRAATEKLARSVIERL